MHNLLQQPEAGLPLGSLATKLKYCISESAPLSPTHISQSAMLNVYTLHNFNASLVFVRFY